MVGFVIVTHARVGEELCACAQGIVGETKGMASVSVDFTKPVEKARGEIEQAVQAVDQGDGVIIMTDMFGGTHSNISLSFLENPMIEVLAGVNLPMLIKGISLRKAHGLSELCGLMEEQGKRGIIGASALLKKKQDSAK